MSLPGGGRRWFVIVNPVAGGGRGLDHFPLISKLLRDAGIQTEPVFTEHKFHATELTVSAVKQGFRRIIAVGGRRYAARGRERSFYSADGRSP